ncbi:MAG: hypothetical protein Q9206_000869 [Seirophora lacunosa]
MHLRTRTWQSTEIEDHSSQTPVTRSNTALPAIINHRRRMARACCTASAHSRQQPGPLLAHRAPGGDCSADNPLRALLRFSTAAREFCPSYLRDNGPLPTYITQYNSAEVSSACACFELSIGCCTTSTGTPDPTADILATTTARTQAKPASRSALDKSPSQTTPSAQLSPDLGSEDPTSARPTEYSYTPDPSTATITASMRGPSTVPDPIQELTSTHYETFTLVNVAFTIAAIPHAQITGSVAAGAIANPYALIDGGDTPSPVAVAASA